VFQQPKEVEKAGHPVNLVTSTHITPTTKRKEKKNHQKITIHSFITMCLHHAGCELFIASKIISSLDLLSRNPEPKAPPISRKKNTKIPLIVQSQ